MRGLTLELASDQPSDAGAEAVGRVRTKYPTAAIAVLSFSGDWATLSPGHARLAEFVVPGEFHAKHGGSR
jgi:phosphohistidine phosphatase